eukprot:6498052-Prymnesium_polylepis.2
MTRHTQASGYSYLGPHTHTPPEAQLGRTARARVLLSARATCPPTASPGKPPLSVRPAAGGLRLAGLLRSPLHLDALPTARHLRNRCLRRGSAAARRGAEAPRAAADQALQEGNQPVRDAEDGIHVPRTIFARRRAAPADVQGVPQHQRVCVRECHVRRLPTQRAPRQERAPRAGIRPTSGGSERVDEPF